MERTSENPADEQAAQWAVRLAHGEIAEPEQSELGAWLARDRRNRGALLRAQAALHLMENAVTKAAADRGHPGNDTVYGAHGARGFRHWAAAVCVAAVLAVGAAFLVVRGYPAPAETRQMQLADGSVVTLQQGARIVYDFDGNRRNVVLVDGKATFEVAHDRAHPFVVRSGDVFAQATGTVYSVDRIGAAGAAVSVTQGSVLVWVRDDNDQAILVHAGDRLTMNPGVDGTKASAREQATISLDDETIESAAKRFNRVNQTQILVADPAIGRTRTVGLFKANEPEKFAQAVAAMTGGRVVRSGGNLVIEAQQSDAKKTVPRK